MVRKLLWLLLSMAAPCVAADVTVGVEVVGESTRARGQMEGIISVTGPEGIAIDADSFGLGGKPLKAEFLNESMRSSLTIINGRRSESRSCCATYRFFFPKGSTGNQELPPVTVRVDGRVYASGPTSYFVCGTERSGQFRMEAFVRGKTTLYPGETAEFVYRLVFRNPVELSDDQLPLLDAKGFRRIGERRVKHDFQGRLTVQEVSQEVQALEPGDFHFDASYVEGYPYRKDFFGHRTYERRKLKAEAPPVTVTVRDFPTEGRPDSFDGALGSFVIRTRLLGSDKVAVGDRLRLELVVSGEGEMASVHCPDLGNQPGFQKLFRLSDLPPTSEESPGQKKFIVEMRPVSAVVTEVPAVRFSCFDPISGTYHETFSQAIPLEVMQLPVRAAAETAEPVASAPAALGKPEPLEGAWRSRWAEPRENQIAGCYAPEELGASDRHPHWWLLSLWPTGALAVTVQARLLRRRRRRRTRPKLARELLEEAKTLAELEHALMAALVARRLIECPCAPESLPVDGLLGAVRAFLLGLEAAQYDQSAKGDLSTLRRQAEELFARIEQ